MIRPAVLVPRQGGVQRTPPWRVPPRTRYVLWRLAHLIPVLLGVSIVVFLLLHLIPGDPARTLLGPNASRARLAALDRQLGLDKPLLSQYGTYLANLLHGNLGTSITYQVPVTRLIGNSVAPTLWLLGYSAVLLVVITIPLGLIAVRWKGRWPDVVVRTLPLVGMGMPTIWVGLVLLLVFGVNLKWFPVSGYGTGFSGHLDSLFLPAFAVALTMIPSTLRSIRTSLIDVMDSAYVTTAKAKGLSSPRTWLAYGLRNAVLPTITVIGVNLGWLVGSTVVVEQVFAIPGMGQLIMKAIGDRDFPTVQALAMLFALLVIVITLVADLLRASLDPRMQLG